MYPIEVDYIRQADCQSDRNDTGIGPIYSTPPFLQHGIGNVFDSLFRWIRLILWSGAKAVGRETLRTGGKILTDIAEKSPEVRPRDIVSMHVNESAQKLMNKLRGRVPKRTSPRNKRKNKKA